MHRVKSMKTKKNKGQAAVEYVLLTTVMVLIFGALFTMIRKNLLFLWVCDMAPRIQSSKPCGMDSTNDCWAQLEAETGKNVKPGFCQ